MTHEASDSSKKRGAPPADPLNAQLARLATRQHGVVTTDQLKKLGLADGTIAHRANTGRLHRIHRGVYAVGHPRLEQKGLWTAAVLAAGNGAVLASLSAAALWDISRWNPDEIFVLAPGKHRRRTDFRLQTCRRLDKRDTTYEHGIPVTTVARTLVDLTDVLTAPQLANVIHEAAFRKLFDERATGPRWRGPTAARGSRGSPRRSSSTRARARTRSALEDRFIARAREAGLPEPEINVEVEGIEVDALWDRSIVEVDGPGHERPRTRAEDAQRDAKLRAAGYDVVRVTAGELAALDARRP